MTLIKNVTRKFKDVNPYDQLFSNDQGHLIKVRVAGRPAVSETLTFDITGSWADEKTGKARLFDDGSPFILAPMELTVMPDSAVDLPAQIEAMRLKMVETAGRAIANYIARQQLGATIKPH